MRDICAGVSPIFGRKSSAPGRKSKKAESFGFMSGAQEILQGLLRRKVTPKKYQEYLALFRLFPPVRYCFNFMTK